MHAALQLGLFWLICLITLGAAVVLLTVFDSLIGNDLDLDTLATEAAIAAVAALIEAGSISLLLLLPVISRPMAAKAMIIPVIMVGLIYQLAHGDRWSRADPPLLLLLQAGIACFLGCLCTAHFEASAIILVGMAFFLALFGIIARSMD